MNQPTYLPSAKLLIFVEHIAAIQYGSDKHDIFMVGDPTPFEITSVGDKKILEDLGKSLTVRTVTTVTNPFGTS